MHCIVSSGGLTKDGKIRKSSSNFFIRTEVLRDKFKGKYMAYLSSLYENGSLSFSSSCEKLRGFLNNRMKNKNLKVIFKLQNGQRFKQRYAVMTMAELLKAVWNFDICLCPECGHPAMKQMGRCYAISS